MGLPYMPISWGDLRGQWSGRYGSPMECLGYGSGNQRLIGLLGLLQKKKLWSLTFPTSAVCSGRKCQVPFFFPGAALDWLSRNQDKNAIYLALPTTGCR